MLNIKNMFLKKIKVLFLYFIKFDKDKLILFKKYLKYYKMNKLN